MPTMPLATEVSSFLECIRENKKPLSDVADGLGTVEVLDAIDQSLRNGGREVLLT